MSDLPTCRWCGKPLRWWIGADRPEYGRGYLGDGLFCSLRHGYNFARQIVRRQP